MSRHGQSLDGALAELVGACASLGLPVADEAVRELRVWAELVGKWRRAARLTALRDPGEVVRSLMVPAVYGLFLTEVRERTVAVDLGCGSGATGAAMASVSRRGRWLLVDRSERKRIFCRYAAERCRIPGVEVPDQASQASPEGTADLILVRGLPQAPSTAASVRALARPDAEVLQWVNTEAAASGHPAIRCGTREVWVVRRSAGCFT